MRHQNQSLPLSELLDHTAAHLKERGYSRSIQERFLAFCKKLKLYAQERDEHHFNTSLAEQFAHDVYGVNICPPWTNRELPYHRMIRIIASYQMTGMILVNKSRRIYSYPVGFAKPVDDFILHRKCIGMSERSDSENRLYMERFAEYLDSVGVNSPNEITTDNIFSYVDALSIYGKQTINHTLRVVRNFVHFAYETGMANKDLSRMVPHMQFNRRGRLPSAYSAEDIATIINTADRAAPLGKRNYAIMLLAARLGLRSGDIANLKFGNIDWENNRVSLVMQKTGKELALPLLEDVGLAVIDYLQNARPPSGSANVFVSHRPPFDGFTSGAVYNLVSRYIAKSGIEVPPMKKRGPHSFRHGLASKLLEEKVPLPVISEILGHSDSLSTSAYLRIDVEQLRMCALEVDEYVCD